MHGKLWLLSPGKASSHSTVLASVHECVSECVRAYVRACVRLCIFRAFVSGVLLGVSFVFCNSAGCGMSDCVNCFVNEIYLQVSTILVFPSVSQSVS